MKRFFNIRLTAEFLIYTILVCGVIAGYSLPILAVNNTKQFSFILTDSSDGRADT